MAAQSLVHEEARRTSVRRAGGRGPVQLGWLHFWLLTVTLGGLLAVLAVVMLFAYR